MSCWIRAAPLTRTSRAPSQTASCGYYTVVCLQALLVVKRYPDSVITMVNRYSHVVVLALSIFVPAIPLSLGTLRVARVPYMAKHGMRSNLIAC